MHLILITSLDALSRDSVTARVANLYPGTPVISHDLLDEGVVTRRVHRDNELVEWESTLLEHGCLSCTVRLDLAPALLRLKEASVPLAIVGLPPGTTAENAIDGLHAVSPQAFRIDTVAVAVRAEDVEDQLWDHHTLFASGYTAVPEDSRTPGEFLVGELLFADTVLTTTSELLGVNEELSLRGCQLIGEVAPHARVLTAGEMVAEDFGVHDDAASRARSLPGGVFAPSASSAPFSTFQLRIDRPLHPDRFRTALGTISEGCCFVRGSVWIAGVLDTRIAVHGVGPRISLGNGGAWSLDTHGELCRGTHLALTGDDIDAGVIVQTLSDCALTDEELEDGTDLPHIRTGNQAVPGQER